MAPPIEIVVLEVLIRMQVTGFSLKPIVFELFAFFYFGPAFYKKIVRYTGRLGGGRRGLAPPIEIVVLEVLIRMQVTGFSLKSIVFELFAFFYFGPAFDKTLGGAGGGGGGLGPK